MMCYLNLAEVDRVLNCFSGLLSVCREKYGKRFPSCGGDNDKVEGGQQDISFCYRKEDMEIAGGDLVSFVIDGAWIAESGCGAAAWVLESTDGESVHQVSACHASSAAAMEVRAGLLVLQWVIKEKLERICIKTDCVVFVQGLNDLASAPFCIRTALADFISLCASLSIVSVIKVPRQSVNAAHAMARAALPRM